jgi:hypothetical protein
VRAALLSLAALAACDGAAPAPPPDPFAEVPRCSSGVTRDPNESEGPTMMPGRACNACHADFNAATGEAAPIFRFSGTVYATGHEPDDCVGVGKNGAQVWVTDSTGFIFAARVNASGNFALEAPKQRLVPPYTAKVVYMGREREMLTPQTNGDCNTCHTQAGASSAPGRIVLP